MLLCMMPRSFANEPFWALNVSTGFNFVGTSQRDLDCIRAFRSNESVYGSRKKNASTYYLSLMPEYYLSTRFALSTGLSVTSTESKFDSDYRFFYYKTAEDGCDTYYYRINSIRQTNLYVGVPIEFRLTIRTGGRPAPYMRAGTTLNFRCSTKSDVNYYQYYRNSNMGGINEKDIPAGDNFVMPVYCAAGCQFGQKNSFSVEITFPYIIVAGSISGLHFTDNLGGGLRLTYQFVKD